MTAVADFCADPLWQAPQEEDGIDMLLDAWAPEREAAEDSADGAPLFDSSLSATPSAAPLQAVCEPSCTSARSPDAAAARPCGDHADLDDACTDLGLGLDPALLGGDADLDLSADMPWEDAADELDDPFGSPGSTASMCMPSPCDPAATACASLGSAPLTASSYDAESDACLLDGPCSQPPASAVGALRASKCAAAAAPAATAAALKMPAPQVAAPAGQAKPFVPGQPGHVVRVMPVWMMPTAQHPQGRMMMMPVHFLPGAAATAMARMPSTASKTSSQPGSSLSSLSREEVSEPAPESTGSRKRRRAAPAAAASKAAATAAPGAGQAVRCVPHCAPAAASGYMVVPRRRPGTGGGGTLPPFAPLPPRGTSPGSD